MASGDVTDVPVLAETYRNGRLDNAPLRVGVDFRLR